MHYGIMVATSKLCLSMLAYIMWLKQFLTINRLCDRSLSPFQGFATTIFLYLYCSDIPLNIAHNFVLLKFCQRLPLTSTFELCHNKEELTIVPAESTQSCVPMNDARIHCCCITSLAVAFHMLPDEMAPISD